MCFNLSNLAQWSMTNSEHKFTAASDHKTPSDDLELWLRILETQTGSDRSMSTVVWSCRTRRLWSCRWPSVSWSSRRGPSSHDRRLTLRGAEAEETRPQSSTVFEVTGSHVTKVLTQKKKHHKISVNVFNSMADHKFTGFCINVI